LTSVPYHSCYISGIPSKLLSCVPTRIVGRKRAGPFVRYLARRKEKQVRHSVLKFSPFGVIWVAPRFSQPEQRCIFSSLLASTCGTARCRESLLAYRTRQCPLPNRTRASEREMAGVLQCVLRTCQSNGVTELVPRKYAVSRSVLLSVLFRRAIVRCCTTRSCTQSCFSVKKRMFSLASQKTRKASCCANVNWAYVKMVAGGVA
jgi:hypothetical protein